MKHCYSLRNSIVAVVATQLLAGAAFTFAAPAEEISDGKRASTSSREDKRTPHQKYQGAYLGAWLQCALIQKKIFISEKAKEKGVTLDPNFLKENELSSCVESGLNAMKIEYANIKSSAKNDEARKALTDHYVAAILHVKETYARSSEDDPAFMKRMNETKRKTDELWVRFEVAQP